jgi:NADPH-dependent glutamate synthase beta subunit-like oxidoreductase
MLPENGSMNSLSLPPGCKQHWRKIEVKTKMALYKHINTTTPQEAKSVLREYKGKAKIVAGGTDIIGQIKDRVHKEFPEVLVNINTIEGLDYIKEQDGTLKIGALTRVEDIANNKIVKKKYTALAEAAHSVASPHIREMGTLGGNLCQSVRCWYYWVPSNRFDCIRKGGKICNAFLGDNRYHSIFGAARIANTPCTTGCPGNVQIPSYFSEIRKGNIDTAAAKLMERNPIPAITGRVCPHPCEKECNRGTFDEPVSVNAVERFIGDHILSNVSTFYKPPQQETGKKVAVVGSGPAGMAAAYYLRKAGHKVTIFDNNPEAGGMLRYGIPGYRLPKDVVFKQAEALKNMGIEFKLKTEVGKDIMLSKMKKDFNSIFIATGAWSQPKLNIDGFGMADFGLDFLYKVNTGNREKPGKKVVVIGGGNVAVDVALSALRLGAEQVTMACLESRQEMPAISRDVDQACLEGIRLMPSWGPSKITKNSIEFIKCTSVFNEKGNFAPAYDSCVMEHLDADRVIMAIGQRPETSFIDLPLKQERGLLIADGDTQATSAAGIFAGGDMTGGTPTVIRSIATGFRAAAAIDEYLTGSKRKDKTDKGDADFKTFNAGCFQKTERAERAELAINQRNIDKEDVFGLAQNEVNQEAERCFNCGCVAVNNSDIVPALIVLNASLKTTRRTIAAERFFAPGKDSTTVLDDDEIVTEVQVPLPATGTATKFIKFALRKSIDYPIVNCAAAIQSERGKVTAARICLNAVYNKPYRVASAEKSITGKQIDEKTAEAAGQEAVKGFCALPANKYKVNIARTLVSRTILACKNTD